ncbi:hypothetical protein [Haloferula sp.]|uniref:hypothetical protein n=1 Tax=Haloferula sp. TaxID=2497595 RepID=UPI003C77ADE0
MLLLVGLARVLMKGEKMDGDPSPIDKLIKIWAGWLVFASLFHEFLPGSGPVFTIGVVMNIVLIYWFSRIWSSDLPSIMSVVASIAFVLAPIALEMAYEKIAGRNLFGIFGGEGAVFIRDGEIRARGPFRHPILAGTVGATCFPLMIGIWQKHRVPAIVGIIACITIVIASRSSGPVVSFGVGAGMVAAWRYRHLAGRMAWLSVIGYFVIELLSNRPAYHVVVTRLDFTGSSTAHYRCRVIDVAIENFSEWAIFGTDHTRHWIPGGIGSVVGDGRHMDITNYYVAMGVMGGFICMMLVIAMMFKAIKGVVDFANDEESGHSLENKFMVWCFGAALFSHAVSAISIAYFDQSQTFFWMTLAVTASVTLIRVDEEVAENETEQDTGVDRVVFPSNVSAQTNLGQR